MSLGIASIVEMTTKDNLPSVKLLEKLGLRFQMMVKMSDDDAGTALYG